MYSNIPSLGCPATDRVVKRFIAFSPVPIFVPDNPIPSVNRIYRSLEHELRQLVCFGKSRHLAKQQARISWQAEYGSLKGYNPAKLHLIYSDKTLKTYLSRLYNFTVYCACLGLRHASEITRYIAEYYLRTLEAAGMSAWTIATSASALNKLFDFDLSPRRLALKPRRKQDIRRSRGPKHYSLRLLADNHDQMTMTLASGIRRMSMLNICPDHFIRNMDGVVIGISVEEKGGKQRIAPILNCYKEEITAIVDRAIKVNGTHAPIFDHYSLRIDNHALRAQYCGDLLHQLEDERAKGLPLFGGDFRLRRFCHLRGKDRYRGPKTAGHDTDLLGAVSGAMGHNRVSVVPRHYLWCY